VIPPGALPDAIAGAPFAVRDAIAVGVGPDRLRSLDLQAPFHGTRAPAGDLSFHDRLLSLATRFRPGDAFSGPTAAMIWGMPLPRSFEVGPLHVATEAPWQPMRRRGVVGSRRDRMRTVRRSGVRLLSPFETWLSLAPILPLDDLIAAGDFLVSPTLRRPALLELQELRTQLNDVDRRVGLPAARRAARWVRSGVWSPRETHVRLLIVRAGFPDPHLNEPIPGSVRRPDLSWPEFRVGVEYNGSHHAVEEQERRDLRRAEEVELLGWTTVNVDHHDLTRGRAALLARIDARLRSRGWRGP
jgi:hypothetical protein